MNYNQLFLVPMAAIVAVTGCATTQQQATLEMAKAWVPAIANALASAASQYTGAQKAQVMDAVAKLQAASADFANLGDVTTARAATLSIIQLAQQIAPLLSVVLGPIAAYVTMGLAVLQAFVAALPLPPAASPMPPAAMLAPAAAH